MNGLRPIRDNSPPDSQRLAMAVDRAVMRGNAIGIRQTGHFGLPMASEPHVFLEPVAP
jgi:hypothetical protein